jgi:23S rRNA (guanine745-N1)-methyltransferase
VVIDVALPVLRCPVCAGGLVRSGGSVRCPAGHAFDVGRGGYLNLRTGRSRRIEGDTAAMVAARESFLGGGHYEPLTARLARIVAAILEGPDAPAGESGTATGATGATSVADADSVPGRLVLEIGAGTGHHLAGVVAPRPDAVGLAVDVSRYALRRAARAHPRIGAVAFDAAAPWPVADGSVTALLDVFAPRNVPEMRRVLHPRGLLLVVTPGADHLAELREPLGLLGMETGKTTRLDDQTSGLFTAAASERIIIPMMLTSDEIVDLAMMGPTGHHVAADELRRRAADAFAEVTRITAAFELRRYRPLGVPGGW